MKKFQLFMPAYLCIIILCLTACNKTEFLSAKPSSKILTPSTLDDFQGLLENSLLDKSPALPSLSADEYHYVSYDMYQSLRTVTERNTYIWNKDIFSGEVNGGDWSIPYSSIFLANNVLEGLEKNQDLERDQTRFKFLKGWALFLRGYGYYELVNNFSPAYDEQTANNDLGIPLKLNPSIAEILPRSSVQQTYDQILADLNAALPLLDVSLPKTYRNHPSQIAVNALLARIYLSMRKYKLAEKSADNSLSLYDKLIDYNTISTTSSRPFNDTVDELIFQKNTTSAYIGINVNPNNEYYNINPSLLASYEINDLRLTLYFIEQPSGNYTKKRMYGGYVGGLYAFSGLAVDEVYLIKSECAARRSDVPIALSYLNKLLINRFKTNSFVPINETNPDLVLNLILEERKKELIFRGLRWSDLKRLNKEGRNITLTRQLDGLTYTLPPNDPRYVFPIPDNEVLYSGIKQNQR